MRNKTRLSVLTAMFVIAVAAIIVSFATNGTIQAQSSREMSSMTLISDQPGEMTIGWATPGETPIDYRIMWAQSGLNYPSWRDANEAHRGNEYPPVSKTSLTLSGLSGGEIYQVKMRSRYGRGNGSGPWSAELTVQITESAPPPTSSPTPSPTPSPAPTSAPVDPKKSPERNDRSRNNRVRSEPTNNSQDENTSRPSAPNDGVQVYTLGSWQSVDLTGLAAFGDTTHKVNLQPDTNYRVEFRTANSHESSTSINAAMRITNNVVSLPIGEHDGSYVQEYDGNGDITGLYRPPSWFRYGASSLEEGVWSNALYQDFRTPNILTTGGNTDCDDAAETSLNQETDCVYRFDFPHHYYLNMGTGIGGLPDDYGTVQFRVSAASDQTLGGMSNLSMDSDASFSLPGHIVDPVLDGDGVAIERQSAADGEIHFAGDIDWYVPQHSSTPCGFAVVGIDLDGNTASGLKVRAYDRNFSEDSTAVTVASTSRGSFRSSLSGVILSGDEQFLEVTGTGAGGYRITETCDPPEAGGAVVDSLGNPIPNIVVGATREYFDDHLPYSPPIQVPAGHPNYGDPTLPLANEERGYHDYTSIDLSTLMSGSVTATLSFPNDADFFRLIGKPEHRYDITLTSVAANLDTPGLNGGTTRLERIAVNQNLRPHTFECKIDSRNDGTEEVPIMMDGKSPTSIGRNVNKDYGNQHIKTDLREAETCMFIGVWETTGSDSREPTGGYRVTVVDEGLTPVNRPPTLSMPIPDQTLVEGMTSTIKYDIPSTTFVDPDGDALYYSATRVDGTILPSWLKLSSGTFTVTHGDADARIVSVKITADDRRSGTASDTFDITVVFKINQEPEGVLPIIGNSIEGRAVWPDMRGVIDRDGIPAFESLTCEWYRLNTISSSNGDGDGTLIDTNQCKYPVRFEDRNKALAVEVSYTDDAGYPDNKNKIRSEPIGVQGEPYRIITSGEAIPGNLEIGLEFSSYNTVEWCEYRVKQGADGAWNPDWTRIPCDSNEDILYTVRRLTNGLEYIFELRAGATVDDEDVVVNYYPDDPESMKAIPREPLGPIETLHNLIVSTYGNSGVQLNWDLPNDPTLTGYQYRYSYRSASGDNRPGWEKEDGTTSHSGPEQGWRSIPGSDHETVSHQMCGYHFGGRNCPQSLTFYPNEEYTFQVRARRDEEKSNSISDSVVVRKKMIPPRLDAFPAHRRVQIVWEIGNWTNYDNEGLQYRYRPTNGTWNDWISLPDPTDTDTSGNFTVRELTNGTEYNFEVRSVRKLDVTRAREISATPN